MMYTVVLLLAILGLSAADFDCCSAEDRKEVQHFWGKLWSARFGDRRVQIAQAIFSDLFSRNPDAKAAFGNVNVENPDSNEFRAHCIRVVNGLDTAIGLFDKPYTLKEQLTHLANQHKVRPGVKKAYFEVIARSFLEVLPQVGGCFNHDAWERCFDGVQKSIASLLAE